MRVLVVENLKDGQEPWWLRFVPSGDGEVEIAYIPETGGSRFQRGIRLLRLYSTLGGYDALVTQQDGYATFLVALINRIRGTNPCVHLVHEFITREKSPGLYDRVKFAFLGFSMKSVDAIQCSARAEIEYYAETLGLDRSRFRFVPLSTNPTFLEVPTDTVGGYVFSAGRTGRDYETLIRAAQMIPETRFRLVVGRDALRGWAVPPNVTVEREIPLADMIKVMAGAACVALPLQDRRISVGQSVLLQAMALGKPIVSTRTAAVVDYLEDGRTALLVPAADPASFAVAVAKILSGPDKARSLGRAAREDLVARFLPGVNIALTCRHLREFTAATG